MKRLGNCTFLRVTNLPNHTEASICFQPCTRQFHEERGLLEQTQNSSQYTRLVSFKKKTKQNTEVTQSKIILLFWSENKWQRKPQTWQQLHKSYSEKNATDSSKSPWVLWLKQPDSAGLSHVDAKGFIRQVKITCMRMAHWMTLRLNECKPKAVTELIFAKTSGKITPLATISEVSLIINIVPGWY